MASEKKRQHFAFQNQNLKAKKHRGTRCLPLAPPLTPPLHLLAPARKPLGSKLPLKPVPSRAFLLLAFSPALAGRFPLLHIPTSLQAHYYHYYENYYCRRLVPEGTTLQPNAAA